MDQANISELNLTQVSDVWEYPLVVEHQGPVVQSVVTLTSTLRAISLTVLADSMHNILIFFTEKMWVAFALQKLLTFFSQKIQHIWVSLDVNFNESLTNVIVSFEQLGPDHVTEVLMHVYTPCIPYTVPTLFQRSENYRQF